jgi:hypothetical protein
VVRGAGDYSSGGYSARRLARDSLGGTVSLGRQRGHQSGRRLQDSAAVLLALGRHGAPTNLPFAALQARSHSDQPSIILPHREAENSHAGKHLILWTKLGCRGARSVVGRGPARWRYGLRIHDGPGRPSLDARAVDDGRAQAVLRSGQGRQPSAGTARPSAIGTRTQTIAGDPLGGGTSPPASWSGRTSRCA